jgi:hypothetical protein
LGICFFILLDSQKLKEQGILKDNDRNGKSEEPLIAHISKNTVSRVVSSSYFVPTLHAFMPVISTSAVIPTRSEACPCRREDDNLMNFGIYEDVDANIPMASRQASRLYSNHTMTMDNLSAQNQTLSGRFRG